MLLIDNNTIVGKHGNKRINDIKVSSWLSSSWAAMVAYCGTNLFKEYMQLLILHVGACVTAW